MPSTTRPYCHGIGLAFVICIVPMLIMVSPSVSTAADLVVSGGKGGIADYPNKAGGGGTGGYVSDGTAYAAGGGGGASYVGGPSLDGIGGENGTAISGGMGGGTGGVGGSNTSSGGDGGDGASSGTPTTGSQKSGANGGAGGNGDSGTGYTATGGSGGIYAGDSSTGGKGGDAAATLTGTATFGTVTVTSGAEGDLMGNASTGAGAGGAASLTADTLTATTITLTKQDGALTTNIATLDVGSSSSGTTLNLNGTSTWNNGTGVKLGDLTFANSKALTVNSGNGGTMTAGGALKVAGAGNAFNSVDGIEYNATSIIIDATGLGVGQTALGGSGVVDISAGNIAVSNFSYAGYTLGQGATLLKNVAGDFTPTTTPQASGSTNQTFTTLKTSGNSLATYVSQTTHSALVVAPGDISVAPTAFGPVTDIYNAGLDMDGHTLTVASNANGTATFSVSGGLKALIVNLTQDTKDLTFTVDTLDVTANNTTLTLTGTTAPNVVIDAINLGGGRTLTVAGTGAYDFTTLNVQGANATYAGDLVADGRMLAFSLADPLAQGDTMLNVQGSADLTGATLALQAQNPLTTLIIGDEFNLIAATGALTDGGFGGTQQLDSLGNKYDLSAIGSSLVARMVNPKTFQEIIQEQFGNAGLGNENLGSGGVYLDEVTDMAKAGIIDANTAKNIGDGFNNAVAPGGVTASRSLQQMFGAYAAYANQALSSDTNRFRRRWQSQNRNFFDTRLFDNFSTASADTGIASDSGLASPRYGARDTIACGQSRVWAGGFGAWADQDNRSNLSGYKYDSRGVALGYEYSIGSLNLGFAAAYSRGDLKVDDLRYKNEADVMNLALYGAYIHESGFYAEGGLGYGHAWNDYKVNSIAMPGGVKKAKYDSDAFTADLELGYIARLPQDFNLIPSVGVEYTYLKNGNWTEKVNNAAIVANRFASGHDNGVDIPVGLRFNKMFRFGCDGGFVVPEVRAAYVYSASKNRPSITAGFAGAPGGAKMVGVDPGRSHWRIGAGLSGRINSRVDFRVDYDFETRSGFKGHNLNASVGLSF